MAPYLFIVPGLFEGPEAFGPLEQELKGKGYENIFITRVISTGTNSKSGSVITMDDDIAYIKKDLEQIVEKAGKDGVVMIAHSAGGFLGPGAMEGLSAPAREKGGLLGGVQKIVFFSGACFPVGFVHTLQPWATVSEEQGDFTCQDFDHLFFNDFPSDLKRTWLPKVKNHPLGWDSTIKYAGWTEVPNSYIIATEDQVLPAALQEQFAGISGAKVFKLAVGHMGQLLRPKEMVEIIATEVPV